LVVEGGRWVMHDAMGGGAGVPLVLQEGGGVREDLKPLVMKDNAYGCCKAIWACQRPLLADMVPWMLLE
jgi:hypothetical protein